MTEHPHNGTRTSIAAAHQIEPAASPQGQKILAFLREQGSFGATAEEIELATGISGSSVRPRLVRLRRDNLVVHQGQVRLTRSGRPAEVWAAAE